MKLYRLPSILLLIFSAAFLVLLSPSSACQAQSSCPEPSATGVQPFPATLAPVFDTAGANKLAEQGPSLPKIYKGYPDPTLVSATVPCILLKAVGMTESGGWKQFRAAYGESGETVISYDYGYGIMQITSKMSDCTPPPLFDRARVAADPVYNIGTGALFLASKWNSVPTYIGTNDPQIVEDWYYAVWAYNGWTWGNNPNNNCPLDYPECGYANNPYRPSFDGSQPRSWYPYQELVWGYAAHPPIIQVSPGVTAPAWTPVSLTLPNPAWIGVTPPLWTPRAEPYHFSCDPQLTFLPWVAREDAAPPAQ